MKETTPPTIQTLGDKKKPKCHRCGAGLAIGARLVIKGAWTCPTCVYIDEINPEAERKKRRRAAPLQEERLFPLPPPAPDVSKRA